MISDQLRERALGSYLGLAVGDALGATTEFMTPKEILATYGVHDRIIGGGWLHLKPGEVTDDTQMALALGDSILESGGFDPKSAADAFVAWMRSKPKDIGNTVRRGLRRYMLQGSLFAPENVQDAGNGAAMRNLPVILYGLHHPQTIRDASLQQAHITHNAPQSDAALLLFADMTRHFLLGGDLAEARHLCEAFIKSHPKFVFDPYKGENSAYIVDTFKAVMHHFFTNDSFETALVSVVNQGGDADTTGAITGMLAGAYYGVNAIPKAWISALDTSVQNQITQQVDGLLALAS